jgi:hypothetical protein
LADVVGGLDATLGVFAGLAGAGLGLATTTFGNVALAGKHTVCFGNNSVEVLELLAANNSFNETPTFLAMRIHESPPTTV